jgi:hypothetical protein
VEAHEDSLLSLITAAADRDRSESTTNLAAKVTEARTPNLMSIKAPEPGLSGGPRLMLLDISCGSGVKPAAALFRSYRGLYVTKRTIEPTKRDTR